MSDPWNAMEQIKFVVLRDGLYYAGGQNWTQDKSQAWTTHNEMVALVTAEDYPGSVVVTLT